MPPIERSGLSQYAVLWRKTGQDNYAQPTVGAAESIRVRWEDKQMETNDTKGNVVLLDAIAIVSEFVPIGSLLWLGRLADVPGTSFHEQDEGLMQVVTSNRVPDIKIRSRRRVLGLKKFRDLLPS